VTPVDAQLQVLEQSNLPPAPAVPVVARESDEVEVVEDRNRSREVGEKDHGSLERADEYGLQSVVVARDLAAELPDAGEDLLLGEVDLADGLAAG
jgi:hypothetical protein